MKLPFNQASVATYYIAEVTSDITAWTKTKDITNCENTQQKQPKCCIDNKYKTNKCKV